MKGKQIMNSALVQIFKSLSLKNLSYRKKVIFICLIISLIPVSLLGFFSYFQQKKQLTEREKLAIHETLNSETIQLNNKLSTYLNTLRLIAWNENIRSVLLKQYDTNSEMYLTYRDTIDPFFLTISSLNKDISNICIYTNHKLYPHGSVLKGLESAYAMPWYQETSNSFSPVFKLSADKKSLYLTCKIYMHSNETSIVCLTINISEMFQSSKSLFDSDYGFLVLDSKNTLTYQYLSADMSANDNSNISFLKNASSKYMIAQSSPLNNTKWLCILYRPTTQITNAINQMKYIVFFIILLCIVLIIFSSAIISNIIVSPLEKLVQNIMQVEKGNYKITVTSNSNDEVGKLIKAFRSMTKQLNYLINEVLLAKIKQQKDELQILQLQINPHFLYNSLSLINGKAIMNNQTDISQMAQLLSTFYRTILNKGNTIITLENELKNVQAYIQIQQIMHSNSFEVIYNINAKALPFCIPNFILQPLAENAILHGLDHKETAGDKILTISIDFDQADIILNVMDNGCGMTSEECKNILSTKSKGYGISNIQQRIQLYYGPSYALTYHSTPNRGTSVTLRIKK